MACSCWQLTITMAAMEVCMENKDQARTIMIELNLAYVIYMSIQHTLKKSITIFKSEYKNMHICVSYDSHARMQ